jgi:hypothetical protein
VKQLLGKMIAWHDRKTQTSIEKLKHQNAFLILFVVLAAKSMSRLLSFMAGSSFATVALIFWSHPHVVFTVQGLVAMAIPMTLYLLAVVYKNNTYVFNQALTA